MSNLSELLLREVLDASYTTKGATLTFAEVDGNFILLANAIKENIVDVSPAGIDAYDGGTEYSNGDLVTYNNNLWEYTNPTPSTGNVPGLTSTFWSIRSAGTLSHAQNTDTHTNQNRFGVGDGENVEDKEIFARNGAATGSEPRLRYNRAKATWEVTNDGANFVDLGYTGPEVVDTTTLSDTILDMRGRPFCVFIGSDIYGAGSVASLDIPNPGGRAVFIFEIEAGKTLSLPAGAKMHDALAGAGSTWTPLETGLYKLEFTWAGSYFFVEASPSPAV